MTFGGFDVLPHKSVPLTVPSGFSFHLSGASLDISEVKQGERCVLCIERHRAYRGEPKGSFPIAALSAPRFEATYLDLYVSSGESVSCLALPRVDGLRFGLRALRNGLDPL